MKIKAILFILGLMAGENLKAAAAAAPVQQRGDAVIEIGMGRPQAVLSPAVSLAEPTASPDEIKREVDREIRERQNAVQRFGTGQDGLFWRTAHKVRSSVSLAGHVLKYPAVASCGVAGPLYWYVKDEFYAPVKSFIRENFTLVAGVIVAGGVGLGLYYGPKDHAVTEGYKHLKDEVADNKEVAKSLAEKYIIERKKKEKLEQLNGVIAAAGVALQELARQTADTSSALTAAKTELAGVKDETARVVRQQQEARVAEVVTFVGQAIREESAQFKELRAIQADPATANDASLLKVTLSTVGGTRLCQETLARMYRTAIGEGLPQDLRALLDELMTNIAPHMENLNTTRLRVDTLCTQLQEQHRLALAADAQKTAALVAAAERPALPAPTTVVSGAAPAALVPSSLAMANYFGAAVPSPLRTLLPARSPFVGQVAAAAGPVLGLERATTTTGGAAVASPAAGTSSAGVKEEGEELD